MQNLVFWKSEWVSTWAIGLASKVLKWSIERQHDVNFKVWNVRDINIIFRNSKTTRHNDKNGWKCEILTLFRRHFSALYLWKYWCVSVSSSFLSLRFHQIERLHFVIVLILKLWNDAPTYTVNSKEYSHHIITRIIMRMLQLAHLAVHLLLRDPRRKGSGGFFRPPEL